MDDSAVGKLMCTTQAKFEEMAINHKVSGCQVLFRSGFQLVLHVYTQSLHMVMMGTAAFFASAVRGVQLAVCLSLPLEEYAQAEVSCSLRACMCMCAHSVVMSAGSAAFVVNHGADEL